jgi:alcohol dehydrogenase class IV
VSIDRFAFPTDIRFGPSARHLLADVLGEAGIRRPLVVTDKGVAGLDIFADLVGALRAAGSTVAVFDGVWGNPVESQVVGGVEAFRAHGADGIVGVGGGAGLDVAKAVALMATHPGDLFDYEDGRADARSITADVAPVVAVPTTAGTGSEVGRSAVISDDETHVKKIVFSPHLLARVVVADPELTVGLPGPITAATGMDALTHNVEAYLAAGFHPICDGIALEGIRLAAANLARAVAHPTDIEARSAMLMASMMGAIAFQKGLGVVHSTAHALGTVVDLHHGLANAVMVDHALHFNVEAAPERFAFMAQAAGCGHDATAFLRWLADLKAEIGVPADLTAAGVPGEALHDLCAVAFDDTCHLDNPRPVAPDDFHSIFVGAFGDRPAASRREASS